MSTVSYDLDTSGGLMPLIRALIKPPDEDLNVQKPKKPQHPYYKRPGKGHNHDSCDACGEGGDLICCDRCPASFHLGCYDPPLDENDIPAGLWLCRECRASDAEKPDSARGSRAQSPVDKPETDKKTRILRNNRSNSKKRSKDEDESKDSSTEQEKPVEKEPTAMEVLVKAARIMNPTQFQLPNEMKIPIIFPGTEKEYPAGEVRSSTTEPGGVWGAACHACSGSCRVAPLLQCDYCPLLFHQDCLDPPLTALPTGRWMCPNHVEQFIDWKLVNSISVTERVALWDKYSGPVDQHAIKIDFLKKARNKAPRFRSKLRVAGRPRVNVPAMIRAQYAEPPSLLPSRREYVRCKKVLEKLKQQGIDPELLKPEGPKRAVCVNLHCPAGEGGVCPAAQKYDACKEDMKLLKSETGSVPSDDESTSSLDSDQFVPVHKRARVEPAPQSVALARNRETDAVLSLVEKQLGNIDERLIKILAWQRIQQVLAGELTGGSHRRTALTRGADRAVRAALSPRPAHAWPSDLLSRADRERIAASVWGLAPLSPPASPAPAADPAPPAAALRAALVPAGSEPGVSVGMRGACLRIGRGSDCELRLDGARCRRVSCRHAVIFMDEVSRHFELINYSEHGTVVNGVLYACDVELSAPTRSQGNPMGTGIGNNADSYKGDDIEVKEEALREVVKNNMPIPVTVSGDVTPPPTCRCGGARGGAPGAWEGGALVPHGALLTFGCLQYVFSIVDDLLPEPVF